eukprot:TRINITY_DN8208_c0_g1_i1.p1 TRINITY_DN8208_c0_g1~~TRINITY_DN8208_c0_g1_i1.p1  ORF type:complete len:250 (-),score=128.37 TRINITY_DN8208_c0_g1_i1:62-811(-)
MSSEAVEAVAEAVASVSVSEAPKPFPKVVVYCPSCGMPPEYCEYGGAAYETCRPWIAEHFPHLLVDLPPPKPSASSSSAEGSGEAGSAEGASSSSSDAAPAKKPAGKAEPAGKQIIITRNQRNRRKCVTEVVGMELYGIKAKEVTKLFANKFAASAAKKKGKTDQIDVQGDVGSEIAGLLEELYNVPRKAFVFREDKTAKGYSAAEEEDDDDDSDDEDDDDDDDGGKPAKKGGAPKGKPSGAKRGKKRR